MEKFENSDKKFNFVKQIKNIRKLKYLSHRDRLIKNILDNKISYGPKNLDIVFKPVKITNYYYNYKKMN